jgi:RNA polymerase sigma-70 factor, ECF subfamily
MSDTDRDLMTRVRRRDEAAFTELVQRYGGKLLLVARRLLGSREDAEDAVQRAFLQCYASAASYRPEWAVSTWLYRILSNICVDELRRRGARARRDRASAETLRLDGHGGPPPAGDLDLRRALQRVPREARVLLTLHYADGLTAPELARVRGISINTVKSQLRRARTILRDALHEGGDR